MSFKKKKGDVFEVELKELLEKVTIDIIMEGCGLVFSLALVYALFFEGGMGKIMEIFGRMLCG